jgi:hypothetical protein
MPNYSACQEFRRGPLEADAAKGSVNLFTGARFLFALASLQELDIHFRAVDPNQLAAAIGKAGGG